MPRSLIRSLECLNLLSKQAHFFHYIQIKKRCQSFAAIACCWCASHATACRKEERTFYQNRHDQYSTNTFERALDMRQVSLPRTLCFPFRTVLCAMDSVRVEKITARACLVFGTCIRKTSSHAEVTHAFFYGINLLCSANTALDKDGQLHYERQKNSVLHFEWITWQDTA